MDLDAVGKFFCIEAFEARTFDEVAMLLVTSDSALLGYRPQASTGKQDLLPFLNFFAGRASN